MVIGARKVSKIIREEEQRLWLEEQARLRRQKEQLDILEKQSQKIDRRDELENQLFDLQEEIDRLEDRDNEDDFDRIFELEKEASDLEDEIDDLQDEIDDLDDEYDDLDY